MQNDFKNDEEKQDRVLELLDHVVGWCSRQNQIWKEVELFFSDQDEISGRNIIVEEDGNSIWAYLTQPHKTEIDKDYYVGTRYEITIEELDIEAIKKANVPPPMIKKYSTEWSQMKKIKEEDLSVEWFEDGDILLKIKGISFLFFHKGESRGFSKSIKENCLYGNAWNEDRFKEILK